MIDQPNSCDELCSEDRLQTLLQDDAGGDGDGGHAVAVMAHVEQCETCRQRLEQLAGDESDLRLVVEMLSESEHDFGSSPTRQHQPPNDYAESIAGQLLDPARHPELLGRLGRYDVERLIGSGGMGIVFRAHDGELNRPVAVKLLAPYLSGSSSARNRFAREARAAAAVVDEHVVAIHNVESTGAHPFLVMKYIAGGSLQQRLDREGPMEVCEILRIGTHAARGLAAAHAQGLIHRDVKPSNILLDEGVERALLTDFGLAHAADESQLTRSGFQPGTPHYMSPEQIRGESIDARSDLFGLGCVLYAMCTGETPFHGETTYAVMRKVTDEEPRLVRDIRPEIPEWLERIVMKLLSKVPEQRFASAAEVAELLENCLAHVQQPKAVAMPGAVAELALAEDRTAGRYGGWTRYWKWIAVAVPGLVLALSLIVLEMGKGTLRIETNSEQDVPIRITQGDQLVRQLTIASDGAVIRLRAGRYEIEVDGSADQFQVEGDQVTLSRGGDWLARVTYSEPVPAEKENEADYGGGLSGGFDDAVGAGFGAGPAGSAFEEGFEEPGGFGDAMSGFGEGYGGGLSGGFDDAVGAGFGMGPAGSAFEEGYEERGGFGEAMSGFGEGYGGGLSGGFDDAVGAGFGMGLAGSAFEEGFEEPGGFGDAMSGFGERYGGADEGNVGFEDSGAGDSVSGYSGGPLASGDGEELGSDQSGYGRGPREMLAAKMIRLYDGNRDAVLTRDEVPLGLVRGFTEIDANEDGAIELDELHLRYLQSSGMIRPAEDGHESTPEPAPPASDEMSSSADEFWERTPMPQVGNLRNPTDCRTLNEVTVYFSEQTRPLRQAFFASPIPDLTVDQLQTAMLKAGASARRGGRMDIAEALQKSADLGILADSLQFIGLTGTISNEFRQLTPGFLHSGAGRRLTVLHGAELRIGRGGWSSSTWGDLHPPLNGVWELVSVEEDGTELSREAQRSWEALHGQWSGVRIADNRIFMSVPEQHESGYEFAVDYDTSALPQFRIGPQEGIRWEGVLLGSGFTDNRSLTIGVDVSGQTRVKTLHTSGRPTSLLKFRRVTEEDPANAWFREGVYPSPSDLMEYVTKLQHRGDVERILECCSKAFVERLAEQQLTELQAMVNSPPDVSAVGAETEKSLRHLLAKSMKSSVPTNLTTDREGGGEDPPGPALKAPIRFLADLRKLTAVPGDVATTLLGLPGKYHISMQGGDAVVSFESPNTVRLVLKQRDGSWHIHGHLPADSAGTAQEGMVDPLAENQPAGIDTLAATRKFLRGNWRVTAWRTMQGSEPPEENMILQFGESVFTWTTEPETRQQGGYLLHPPGLISLTFLTPNQSLGSGPERQPAEWILLRLGPDKIELRGRNETDGPTSLVLRRLNDDESLSTFVSRVVEADLMITNGQSPDEVIRAHLSMLRSATFLQEVAWPVGASAWFRSQESLNAMLLLEPESHGRFRIGAHGAESTRANRRSVIDAIVRAYRRRMNARRSHAVKAQIDGWMQSHQNVLQQLSSLVAARRDLLRRDASEDELQKSKAALTSLNEQLTNLSESLAAWGVPALSGSLDQSLEYATWEEPPPLDVIGDGFPAAASEPQLPDSRD